MTTPTRRTLVWLRDNNWTAAVVERWNSHTNQRQDLFGFADIVAFRGPQVILIQATSGANTASRKAKILANDTALLWLEDRPIWVVGWRQLVAFRKDGTKAKRKRWTPKIEVLGVTNLDSHSTPTHTSINQDAAQCTAS